MGKIIRPTYPKEFSIGLLILIFVLSFFLSTQIFNVSWRELMEGTNVYLGMFLVSTAVLIMVLILWEELLFPVKVKTTNDGVIFRNHRTKLKTQFLIYFAIPVLFAIVYLKFEVNLVRFIVWTAVCTLAPVVIKFISGINNYNDFLKLTNDTIEYKNNKEAGTFSLKDIQHLTLVRDQKVLHKIQVSLTNNSQVIIDLDEMELAAFLESIDKFITSHYKTLVKS
ncbi:MAG TPA: heavy metal transporter [Ohtaekwangia sp.]|uniref:heavy metal transporter n=1 Tax=Ohtaekwangia sp. TaxID=2066019 RepID=UPI002F9458B8